MRKGRENSDGKKRSKVGKGNKKGESERTS